MGDTTRAALIFLNPRAGSGGAESLRIILSSALDQYAWRQTWVVIEKETHARELVPRLKQAAVEKIERVFVCGGDGTASMVASAIISAGLKEQLPLAIFPAGTGNSLARELGIPSDWTQAAQLLCSLESCLGLDAMRMGEKYYFLRIGAGLDAEAIQETSREQKRFLGRWAYFKSFLSKLFRPHRVHFRCIIDGRRRRLWAVQVFVANGGSMALVPFRIGPGIRLHDGILNVCAYDALNWWDYLTVGWKLFRRDYHNQPLLKFWPVRYSVRIEANPSVPVQGDGEPRTHTPVLVEVVPEAVQVISPRGTHS